MSPAQTALIGAQLAAALAGRHQEGRCHGAVSPASVWFAPDGRAVLLAPTEVTAPSTAYLAPERVTGAPPSPAADVYALGVVLVEAIAGPEPVREVAGWPGVSPVVPNEVPGPLADVLLGMTQPSPEDRPTAAHAAARLATVAGRASAHPSVGRRHLGWLLTFGLPVLVLLGLLAVALLTDPAGLPGQDGAVPPAVASAGQDGSLPPVSGTASTPGSGDEPASSAPGEIRPTGSDRAWDRVTASVRLVWRGFTGWLSRWVG